MPDNLKCPECRICPQCGDGDDLETLHCRETTFHATQIKTYRCGCDRCGFIMNTDDPTMFARLGGGLIARVRGWLGFWQQKIPAQAKDALAAIIQEESNE